MVTASSFKPAQQEKVVLEIIMSPADAELIKDAARLHFGTDVKQAPDLAKYIDVLINEDIERIMKSIQARES